MNPNTLLHFLNLDFPFLHNEKKSRNDKYICMWTEVCDVNFKDNFFIEGLDRLDYIRQKLSEFPDQIPYLVEIKNQFGKTAISVASDDIIEEFKNHLYFCGKYEIMRLPVIHQSDTSLVIQAKDHSIVKDIYLRYFNEYKDVGTETMSEKSFQKCFEDWNPADDYLHFRVISSNNDSKKVFDFQQCDLDKCGTVDFHEFKNYCESIFGSSRNVVLKFMKNEDQYQKEIDTRENNHLDSKYIINIIMKKATSENEKDFAHAIKKALQLSIHNNLYKNGYKYMIVMHAADRSLEDIIKKEKLDDHVKMLLLYEIAQAIQYLHSQEVLHGDIKALNIVRTEENGKVFVKLIDLDASADFESYACTKFSSGILPPEMFVNLNESTKQQFDQYINDIANNNEKLLEKMKPIYDEKRKCYYGVRVFDMEVSKKHAKSLGEDFYVKASPAIDVWSFGVLMYYMLHINNETLFTVNINDDLSRKNGSYEFRKVIEITDTKIEELINKTSIQDQYARNLLIWILKKNPKERPSFSEILV